MSIGPKSEVRGQELKPTSYHAYHDPDDPRRIKDIIIEALLDGQMPHEDIATKVRTMYPHAQTTVSVRSDRYAFQFQGRRSLTLVIL